MCVCICTEVWIYLGTVYARVCVCIYERCCLHCNVLFSIQSRLEIYLGTVYAQVCVCIYERCCLYCNVLFSIQSRLGVILFVLPRLHIIASKEEAQTRRSPVCMYWHMVFRASSVDVHFIFFMFFVHTCEPCAMSI